MSDTVMSLALSVIAVFVGIQALHALIVAVRTEVNSEIKDARDELKSEVNGVRDELKLEFDNRLGATESRLLKAIDRLAA